MRRVDQVNGFYEVEWDGRDGGGELVGPGMYVYRLSVDLEKGGQHRAGVLSVVY